MVMREMGVKTAFSQTGDKANLFIRYYYFFLFHKTGLSLQIELSNDTLYILKYIYLYIAIYLIYF